MNKIEEQVDTLSHSQEKFLHKYEAIFAKELPLRLPPSRVQDHTIDSIPGSVLPCQAPYCQNQIEQK